MVCGVAECGDRGVGNLFRTSFALVSHSNSIVFCFFRFIRLFRYTRAGERGTTEMAYRERERRE